MPFIVAGKASERGPGFALSEAGRRIVEVSSELATRRRQMERDKRADAEADRRFEIAELNAKRQLLSEANRAKALAGREDAKAAAMEGAVGEFKDASQKNQVQSWKGGLRDSLKSSGGVIGPFGALNGRKLRGGLEAAAASKKRMAGKLELAKRMDPSTARGYLERAAAEETQTVMSAGYQREAEALEDAVAEGRISEEEAKPLVKELQAAIQGGKPPGNIETRIAKAYDLQAKALTRAQGWEEADTQAAAMIDGLRQLVGQVGDGVDPETGKSMKAALTERLAQAKVEWNRTRNVDESLPNRFREKNEPQDALNGLQAILFEAQAEADPQGFMEEDREEQNSQRIPAPTQQQKVGMGISDPDASIQGAGGIQNRAGARQAPEASPVAQRSARAATPKRGDEQTLRAFVKDRAKATLGGGRDAKAGVIELLKAAARDLGLNVNDPAVLSIVKDELNNIVHGKAGRSGQ